MGISNAVQGGIKKLEDVFDQRVIAALERSGLPTVKEFRRLSRRVDQLTLQLRALHKPAGSRKARA